MIYAILVDNKFIKSVPYPTELSKAQKEREAYRFANENFISEKGVSLVPFDGVYEL